jgi:hypothetical protein
MSLASEPSHAQAWVPDPATIQKLEATIQEGDYLKRGGAPLNLARYARYYAGYTDNRHRLIAGEFIRSTIVERAPGIQLLPDREKFPVIFDGGCSVINVVYDVDSAKMLSVNCNGVG